GKNIGSASTCMLMSCDAHPQFSRRLRRIFFFCLLSTSPQMIWGKMPDSNTYQAVDGAIVTRYLHSGQQIRRFGAIKPVFQGIDSEGAVMLSAEFVRELRMVWLPNVSDAGLDRIIELLEKGSPLLVKGRFTGVMPTGCLATHVAWNHPRVSH